jgi:hypothetical protein
MVKSIMSKYWGWQFPDMTPEQSGKEYARLSSELRALGPKHAPLFNVQFYTWDEIISGVIISIDYPIVDGVCFAEQKTLETFVRLHPNVPFNKNV